jgi:hypothetical protein
VARNSLGELIGTGHLAPGQRLVATHRRTHYAAEVTTDGSIRIDGDGVFKSPSSAAASITGHNTNGWQFWRTEHNGRALADLRPMT